MSIQTISRIVYYYDLFAKFDEAYHLDPKKFDTHFQALLSKINKLVKDKDPSRYQALGDRILFINEISITPVPKKMIIKGKLLAVRKDFFPELLNTNTDLTRDINAADEEGIVETTHFMIQQRKEGPNNKLKIAIEHNQYGAKIYELEYYLLKLGGALGVVKRLEHSAILRDSLSKAKKRIGEISRILIRIKKDNIAILEKPSNGLWTVLNAAQEEFEEEYLTLELKYNIHKARKHPNSDPAKKSKSLVNGLINMLVKDKNKVEKFERLEVLAEDSEKYDKLNAFDLLIDRAKDVLSVERKLKSRTIVSVDMFAKMEASWSRNRIL